MKKPPEIGRPRSKLTPRERQVIKVIAAATLEKGYAPTLIEIRDTIGVKSDNTVTHAIRSLIQLGWLQRLPRSHRGLGVLKWPTELDTAIEENELQHLNLTAGKPKPAKLPPAAE